MQSSFLLLFSFLIWAISLLLPYKYPVKQEYGSSNGDLILRT